MPENNFDWIGANMATARDLTKRLIKFERELYAVQKSNSELVRFCEETQEKVGELIDSNNALTGAINILTTKVDVMQKTEKIIRVN